MAEFTEIAKIKARMCKKYDRICINKICPLSFLLNGKNVTCIQLFEDYPEEYERICLDWAKENPEITNADKFMEVFNTNARPECCPYCDSRECELSIGLCCNCKHHDFWNKPYVENKVLNS